MKPQTLRHAMIGLLLFTSVLHLITAMVGGGGAYNGLIAIFGVVYGLLAYWVRRDVTVAGDDTGRRSIIVTIAITALAVTGGGAQFLTKGGPGVLYFMGFIDFLIIAAGCLWLTRAPTKN
ncbi:MAG: hypothetical protein AAGB02_05200 [Pseudomonadota bacterium]